DPIALLGRDGFAVEYDLAGGGRVVARDHVEEGRLAGAIRADQRHDRPTRNVEVDAPDGRQTAERLHDPPRSYEHVRVVEGAGDQAPRRGGPGSRGQRSGGHRSRASSGTSGVRASGPVSSWPGGALITLSMSWLLSSISAPVSGSIGGALPPAAAASARTDRLSSASR